MQQVSPTIRTNSWLLVQVFALAGAVIIGFHEVLVEGNAQWGVRAQGWFWNILDGKVQAMLFLFAGVALYKVAENPDKDFVKRTIAREGGILIALGLISGIFWHQELLLPLGLCSLLAIPFVLGKRVWLWPAAALFTFLMPLLAFPMDLDASWDFSTLRYTGFWAPKAIFSRIFIDGYYPVISWMPYVLIGIWLGKFNLERKGIRPSIMWFALMGLFLTAIASWFLRFFDQLMMGYGIQNMELFFLFKLEKNHAMPLFIIHNLAWALFLTTSLSIWRDALPTAAHRLIAPIAMNSSWILFAQAVLAMSIIKLAGLERSLSLNQSWLVGLGWLATVAVAMHFFIRRKEKAEG
jgi:uncharacterized protein